MTDTSHAPAPIAPHYTLTEAAALLRRCSRTVLRMAQRGEIRLERSGPRSPIHVPASEVARLLTPTTAPAAGEEAGDPKFYTARTKRAVNSLTIERGPKVVPHE